MFSLFVTPPHTNKIYYQFFDKRKKIDSECVHNSKSDGCQTTSSTYCVIINDCDKIGAEEKIAFATVERDKIKKLKQHGNLRAF